MTKKCAAWCAAEEAIIAKIREAEAVERPEAIRRMQRRKAALGVRLTTDMPEMGGRVVTPKQIENLTAKFIRPEERAYVLTPARAAILAKATAARKTKAAQRRRMKAVAL